ncbi:MAG TPA: single-stranded-DNA-specific exonuclease RecJ, partial [Oxalobacteraceae bacterium]|nr:single-stranded-DNA-specific exonuclease RecJ [Oxalobacteraceae bacterium]
MTRIATRAYPFRTAELLRQQGVHPVLARLYAARGLVDVKDLASELNALIAPSGLLHIDAAAVFLADAIAAGKKMVIVADYDCDGATACAVALRGLRALGAQVDFIVPNRFEYGYGLTPEIVALTAQEKSPDIIITVDNGIASI